MERLELMPIRMRITYDLRNAILSGEFQPGQEMNLSRIAESLNVSRTPVREAFQALAQEGFIELRMNKGAIVTDIDEKFIRDHYEMRQLLEGEAAARVARLQPDISALMSLQKEAEAKAGEMEKDAYRAYNLKLHTGLWHLADNSKLTLFLSELWNGPSMGKITDQAEHQRISILEHRNILNYIQDGDPDSARHAMEAHVVKGMSNILTSRQAVSSGE